MWLKSKSWKVQPQPQSVLVTPLQGARYSISQLSHISRTWIHMLSWPCFWVPLTISLDVVVVNDPLCAIWAIYSHPLHTQYFSHFPWVLVTKIIATLEQGSSVLKTFLPDVSTSLTQATTFLWRSVPFHTHSSPSSKLHYCTLENNFNPPEGKF